LKPIAKQKKRAVDVKMVDGGTTGPAVISVNVTVLIVVGVVALSFGGVVAAIENMIGGRERLMVSLGLAHDHPRQNIPNIKTEGNIERQNAILTYLVAVNPMGGRLVECASLLDLLRIRPRLRIEALVVLVWSGLVGRLIGPIDPRALRGGVPSGPDLLLAMGSLVKDRDHLGEAMVMNSIVRYRHPNDR
jgi:hypothetical protein